MAQVGSLERIQSPKNNRFNNPFKGLFANFRGDLTGGLTAAVLALAFAVASGVEPKAGLYTAIVAGAIAAVFGGSPVQITGPTGAMAVVLVGIVAKYGIEKVWIAGVMAGIIQIALGVAKLGRLVKFIPYPVTAGFTNGIAVIIFCGQLNNFFGLHLPNQEHFLQALWQTLTNLVTVCFDIVLAVEVGLIAAGILFIKRMSELSLVKMPEDSTFLSGIPLEFGKQIAIYRIDGPMFFGAAERFVSFLREAPEVKFLILRMRYVPSMDTTGLVALEEIYRDLQRHNCQLILSGLRPEVEQLLDRSGLLQAIGRKNSFNSTDEALRKIMPNLDD